MRLLAEWEKQKYIMVVFPFANSAWDENLVEAENTYTKIIDSISKKQQCVVFANNQSIKKRPFNKNVKIQNITTNDTWVRDFGPISLEDNKKIILKEFTFNGWGNKYNANHDNDFNKTLFRDITSLDMTLEGGAIESNGSNTILTSKQTILNNNRNPNMKINEIKKLFQKEFGVEETIILENCVLEGDDTDSHIDMFCRFVNADTIAHITTEDKSNPNYKQLKELVRELKTIKNFDSKEFNLVELPLPNMIYHKKRALPVTYANFLITNESVLVPVYNDKNDRLALEKIASCFKGRNILGINSLPLIRHGGAIHCVTMPIF